MTPSDCSSPIHAAVLDMSCVTECCAFDSVDLVHMHVRYL